jgi:hypothetical protein
MIYFVRCGKFVKIGRASEPMQRAENLQIGNPHKVQLLGVLDGDHIEEKGLHKLFSAFHHRAEWFRWSEEIERFVAEKCTVPFRVKPRRYQITVKTTPEPATRRRALSSDIGITISELIQGPRWCSSGDWMLCARMC